MTTPSLTIQLAALEKAVYWLLCERSAQMGDEDGNITISVRNNKGGVNEITLPKIQAKELAEAIAKHTID